MSRSVQYRVEQWDGLGRALVNMTTEHGLTIILSVHVCTHAVALGYGVSNLHRSRRLALLVYACTLMVDGDLPPHSAWTHLWRAASYVRKLSLVERLRLSD